MKYNGTSWMPAGQAGFSAGEVAYLSLAFDPSGGQLYVAYQDWENSFKATVMTLFGAIGWIYTGAAGFSAGRADFTTLAFSPTGEPYVAYADYGNSQKATVMKFDSVFVGINEIRPSLHLTIYPVPATDNITIETSSTSPQCQLSVITPGGQEIMTTHLAGPFTQLDIRTLPAGIYFVKVTNEKTVEIRQDYKTMMHKQASLPPPMLSIYSLSFCQVVPSFGLVTI